MSGGTFRKFGTVVNGISGTPVTVALFWAIVGPALSTSAALHDLEEGQTHWVAQVGVGVLEATPDLRPSAAIAKARDMSRTAWSYRGRVAWQEPGTGRIAEMPAAQLA